MTNEKKQSISNIDVEKERQKFFTLKQAEWTQEWSDIKDDLKKEGVSKIRAAQDANLKKAQEDFDKYWPDRKNEMIKEAEISLKKELAAVENAFKEKKAKEWVEAWDLESKQKFATGRRQIEKDLEKEKEDLRKEHYKKWIDEIEKDKENVVKSIKSNMEKSLLPFYKKPSNVSHLFIDDENIKSFIIIYNDVDNKTNIIQSKEFDCESLKAIAEKAKSLISSNDFTSDDLNHMLFDLEA